MLLNERKIDRTLQKWWMVSICCGFLALVRRDSRPSAIIPDTFTALNNVAGHKQLSPCTSTVQRSRVATPSTENILADRTATQCIIPSGPKNCTRFSLSTLNQFRLVLWWVTVCRRISACNQPPRRSTQPSTLRGSVKWVSAFGLSNNKWRWWMWFTSCHIPSGPKKRYPCFNFAITSVSVHRF